MLITLFQEHKTPFFLLLHENDAKKQRCTTSNGIKKILNE